MPALSLDTDQTLDLKEGASLKLWEGRASGLKDVRVRLLLLADGKSRIAQEISHGWNDWPGDQAEPRWRLYLLQDVEGKVGADHGPRWRVRVPWVGTQFDVTPPRSAGAETQEEVGGQFVSTYEYTAPRGDIKASEQRVVFFRYYFPRAGVKYSIDPGETVESLTKKAVDGRVIVALTVEWK